VKVTDPDAVATWLVGWARITGAPLTDRKAPAETAMEEVAPRVLVTTQS